MDVRIEDYRLYESQLYRFSTLEKREEGPLLSTKILFSDEAYFWPNEHVKKQNCHNWAEEQPEEN